AQHPIDGGLVEAYLLELLHERPTRERLAHEREQGLVLARTDDHDGWVAAVDGEVDLVVVHERAGARTSGNRTERDRRVEVAGQGAQVRFERVGRGLGVA